MDKWITKWSITARNKESEKLLLCIYDCGILKIFFLWDHISV